MMHEDLSQELHEESYQPESCEMVQEIPTWSPSHEALEARQEKITFLKDLAGSLPFAAVPYAEMGNLGLVVSHGMDEARLMELILSNDCPLRAQYKLRQGESLTVYPGLHMMNISRAKTFSSSENPMKGLQHYVDKPVVHEGPGFDDLTVDHWANILNKLDPPTLEWRDFDRDEKNALLDHKNPKAFYATLALCNKAYDLAHRMQENYVKLSPNQCEGIRYMEKEILEKLSLQIQLAKTKPEKESILSAKSSLKRMITATKTGLANKQEYDFSTKDFAYLLRIVPQNIQDLIYDKKNVLKQHDSILGKYL